MRVAPKLSLLFAVPLLLAFGACGAPAEPASESTPAEVEEIPPAEPRSVPTVGVPPLEEGSEEWLGEEGGSVQEIHVKLQSGAVIVCLYSNQTYSATTCDWDHPLVEAPAR